MASLSQPVLAKGPSFPAHGPWLSVPAPATPRQGWSWAPPSQAHRCRPTAWPGLGLSLSPGRCQGWGCPDAPSCPGPWLGCGMGPSCQALTCPMPWGTPPAPAAQGAAGPHGTMTLFLKLGFQYNLWRLFPIEQSVSMLTED